MAEFEDIFESGIELAENMFQARFRVVKTRRELEEKTAQFFIERGDSVIERPNQSLRAFETFLVRDQAVHFDAIFEIPAGGLANPAAHGGSLRPAIKRRIELDGFEFLRVMRKPFVSGKRRADRRCPASANRTSRYSRCGFWFWRRRALDVGLLYIQCWGRAAGIRAVKM